MVHELSFVMYSTVQYSPVQYCAVQYSLCLTNHLSGVAASQLWIFLESGNTRLSPQQNWRENYPDWETVRI